MSILNDTQNNIDMAYKNLDDVRNFATPYGPGYISKKVLIWNYDKV